MTNPVNPNDIIDYWGAFAPPPSAPVTVTDGSGTVGTSFTTANFAAAVAGLQSAQVYTPQPQVTMPNTSWQPESPSFYFEDPSHQSMFKAHRNQRQMHNAGHRPGPVWTEEDELKLVDYLWIDWFDEPYPGNTWTYDDLNLDTLEVKPLRKYELRPFKINYETYSEIKLRLLNTVISIKGHPFLVQKIANTTTGFKLAVTNGEKTQTVMYNDIIDLRTMPPMYINGSSYPGWMCRVPGRVYQQGMNRSNTILKSLDGKQNLTGLEAQHFIKTFHKRKTRKWDETLSSLLQNGEMGSLRMSDEVAVKVEKGKVLACYRGRFLGKIQDNDIIVGDEDDLLQQWIERSVKEVGLELRA